MYKSFYYELRPNKKQATLIVKTFGCVRFVWNQFLALRKDLWEEHKISLNKSQCSKILTVLKREKDWLKEPDKNALQAALENQHEAYQRFFKKQSGFPKFKTRHHSRKSYTSKNNNGSIKFLGNKIQLPKLGKVKIRGGKKLVPEGRIIKAIVSQKPDGRFYVSLCCEVEDRIPLPKTGKNIGLDMGLKIYLTGSDGLEIENPRFYRNLENKIAKAQRRLSKRQKGSRRFEKARLRLARLYRKVFNRRKDFLNKLTTDLVRNYDLIAMEDLRSSNMMQNHHLAKSIGDASWYMFYEMLKYKCRWYGKTIILVDPFFPSSQLCSHCGYKNPEVKDLSVRKWDCPECGSHNERDKNASVNILNEAIRIKTAGTAGIAR